MMTQSNYPHPILVARWMMQAIKQRQETENMVAYRQAMLEKYAELYKRITTNEVHAAPWSSSVAWDRYNLLPRSTDYKNIDSGAYFLQAHVTYQAAYVIDNDDTKALMNLVHDVVTTIPSLPGDDPLLYLVGAAASRMRQILVIPDWECEMLELPVITAQPGEFLGENLSVVVAENANLGINEFGSSSFNKRPVMRGRYVRCYVDKGAELSWYANQNWSSNTDVFEVMHVTVQEGGSFTYQDCALGAGQQKRRVYVELVGKDASATVNGAYVMGAGQHLDIKTYQLHTAVDTTSSCSYRGAAGADARVSYQGAILIGDKASGTKADQEHKTILLSDKAQVSSVPALEVQTDDVRCGHGAATAPLDPQQLWYLMAHGVELSVAQKLILEGFILGLGLNARVAIDGVMQTRLDKKLDTLLASEASCRG